MKYFLLLVCLLSSFAFAIKPDQSEIIDRTNDEGTWKVLVVGPYRYYSPDGQQVLVCLKRFIIDEAATKSGVCVDEQGNNSWTNARSIKISGYKFNKFELKYSQNGYDKQGRTVVRISLLVHFKKNIYI